MAQVGLFVSLGILCIQDLRTQKVHAFLLIIAFLFMMSVNHRWSMSMVIGGAFFVIYALGFLFLKKPVLGSADIFMGAILGLNLDEDQSGGSFWFLDF